MRAYWPIMDSRVEDARKWLKIILTMLGLGLLLGAAIFWALYGFNSRKLVICLTGLLLLAAGRFSNSGASIYADAALILLNAIVLLVILETAASGVLWLSQQRDERTARIDPYYKNHAWGADYLHDVGSALRVAYKPYVIWKTKPYQGKTINVDQDGHRLTPGAMCGKDSYNVLMFGGSTVWGDGVPDWGTVPAYVQSQLSARRKEPVCVRNFGQPGWVSTQGVIELLRQLQTGKIPNLVIFYDGVNDIGVASDEGAAGGHESISLVARKLQRDVDSYPLIQAIVQTNSFRLFERFVPTLSRLREWPGYYLKSTYDPEVFAGAITQTYLTNCRAIKALARDFGFVYAFFWQPTLGYGNKPLTAEEKQLLQEPEVDGAETNELFKAVYPKVQELTRSHDRLFYIADIFAHSPERIYLNDAHLTHTGNEIVARRMVGTLMQEEADKNRVRR